MPSVQPAAGAFAAVTTPVSVFTADTIKPYLSALHDFFAATPGAGRLLDRALRAPLDVSHGTADAALIFDASGRIVAAALLYHHSKELCEIGSALVAPDQSGLYPHLREALVKHAHALGKTVTLFERLGGDAILVDYLHAQRRAEGWQEMSWEHPDFHAIELSKAGMPPSNGGFPPKIGFRMAVGDGMIFASSPAYGDACYRRRNPAFTLGR